MDWDPLSQLRVEIAGSSTPLLECPTAVLLSPSGPKAAEKLLVPRLFHTREEAASERVGVGG